MAKDPLYRPPAEPSYRVAESRTKPPAPNTFIDIHIINENMPHLAHTMRMFLESRTYAGRTPRVESKAYVPVKKIFEIEIDVVIFEVDEYTDAEQILESLRAVYDDSVDFIAHSEHENDDLAALLAEAGTRGLAVGWDFNQLASLIEEIAKENPVKKNSKPPKAP